MINHSCKYNVGLQKIALFPFGKGVPGVVSRAWRDCAEEPLNKFKGLSKPRMICPQSNAEAFDLA